MIEKAIVCAVTCSLVVGNALAEPIFLNCGDEIYRIDEAERTIRSFDDAGQFFKNDMCSPPDDVQGIECTFTDEMFRASFVIEDVIMRISIYRFTGKHEILITKPGMEPNRQIVDCKLISNPILPGRKKKF